MDEKKQLTTTTENVETTVQYIVVKIDNEQYGIRIKYIDNIVRMQSITRVPKAQEYFNGVINLRGEIIPVMSLRIKLGLPSDVFTDKTRIIIIKVESGTVGMIVDEVREVVTLGGDDIEKSTYDATDDKNNFISGIGKVNGGLVSLLDIQSVLVEKE